MGSPGKNTGVGCHFLLQSQPWLTPQACERAVSDAGEGFLLRLLVCETHICHLLQARPESEAFTFTNSFDWCWEPAYCILSAALSTASSFRIWNSSTGILSLPGASVRNSAHDNGHEEGGSAYAKAGSSLRSPPGNSRASTPKTRVCLLSALCFHLHL